MIQVQGLDRPFRALGVDCVPPRALPWAGIALPLWGGDEALIGRGDFSVAGTQGCLWLAWRWPLRP